MESIQRKRKANSDIHQHNNKENPEMASVESPTTNSDGVDTASSRREHNNLSMTPTSSTSSALATGAESSSTEETTREAPNIEPELWTCPKCGHDVSTANLVVHDANCQRGRGRHSQEGGSPPSSPPAMSSVPFPSHGPLSSNQQESSQETTPSSGGWRLFSQGGTGAAAGAASAMYQGEAIASASSVSVSTQSNQAENNSTGNEMRTASFVGNIRPPPQSPPDVSPAAAASRDMHSSGPAAFPSAVSSASATNENNGIHLEEGQWSCPRCTLINNSTDIHCNACLLPRPGSHNYRPPDSARRDQLIPPFPGIDEGWVNVTSSDFGRNGAGRDANNNNSNNSNNGPTFRQRINLASRIFNGAVNGAVFGSILGGVGGLIIGGIGGGFAGAMADGVVRTREDQQNREIDREVEELMQSGPAAGIPDPIGGLRPGTMRIHRGGGHILAVSVDQNGRRIVRIPRRPSGRPLANGNGENLGEDEIAELERRLAETLLRMSYMHNFAPRNGNVLFQPDASFEELIERFGMGNDNRGASQEIIDSYPVEIVGDGAEEEEKQDDGVGLRKRKNVSNTSTTVSDNTATSQLHSSSTTTAHLDYGTCGICLEDFQRGDVKKKLSCPNHPHSFHKDCIDKWLKQVSNCPICKSEVGMYQESKSNDTTNNTEFS
mmetsp:Transcript_14207/g.27120  ORF Transcript_14207/g.27120 Transcript_14207/m.27120 type:complete len:663 (-) Transcript_14207:98-2086(-)